jgi:acetyl esterase/lipase
LWNYQSFRTQIFRAYLIATFALPTLPVEAPEAEAKLIEEKGKWKGYIIPGTRDIKYFARKSSTERRVVALYAHGGGYGWGEARQYLSYMRRWVECARAAKVDLVFVSVEYPLSGEAPHPEFLHGCIPIPTGHWDRSKQHCVYGRFGWRWSLHAHCH